MAVMQQTLDLTQLERETVGQVMAQVQMAQQRLSDVATGILAGRGIAGAHQMEFGKDLKTMTIRPVEQEPPAK